MKKAIVVISITSLLLSGCARSLYSESEGTTYQSYGFFNETVYRSKKVCYQVSAINVILGIIFIETVIVPIYIVGWSLFEPGRLKRGPNDQCGYDD